MRLRGKKRREKKKEYVKKYDLKYEDEEKKVKTREGKKRVGKDVIFLKR